MTDAPVPSREGSRLAVSVISLFFILVGYALAGFGAVLILDGGQRVVSMILAHSVFVAPRSVSTDFAVAVSLVAAGVGVFVVGRILASLASGQGILK